MMFKNHQITQLQAKIKRLKREKAQLRAFLHELVEAHYRVINQEPEKEPDLPKEENMDLYPESEEPFQEPKKFHEIHNSSDLLDQMTEKDIDNLKHGTKGESGYG